MLYKSIIPTNDKLKYVVINNLTTDLNDSNLLSIYVFNDKFFFILKLSNNLFMFNRNSNDIYVKHLQYNLLANRDTLCNSKLFSKLNGIFYSWDSYYFNKLIIDGKAYRITKFKKNNFKLMFGRSHIVLLLAKGVFLRKKKKIKKKFMFYGVNKGLVNVCSIVSRSVRPNDMFTDRGLRFSKQINNRKLGKKGSSSVL